MTGNDPTVLDLRLCQQSAMTLSGVAQAKKAIDKLFLLCGSKKMAGRSSINFSEASATSQIQTESMGI